MSNTPSKTTRYIVIVCITLAVVVAAVILIPRGVTPEKKQAEKPTGWSHSVAPAYTAPAKVVMLAIVDAAKTYHDQTGSWPTTVAQIEQRGLIAIPDSVNRWWMFAFSGGPITSLSAMSTDSMPDGPGHALVYRPETGRWIGYGAASNR